jgi:hypothetical protein
MNNNYPETNSLETLKKFLKEGDTVYTIVKRVSRSGMSRLIKFYTIKENKIVDLSCDVASILGCRYSYDKDGVKVDGCGMDMCFASVYKVASELCDDGYKLITGYL